MENFLNNVYKFMAIIGLIALLALLIVLSQYLIDYQGVSLKEIINYTLLGTAVILYVVSWNYLNFSEKAGLAVSYSLASFVFEVIMLIIVLHTWWAISSVLTASTLLGIIVTMENVEIKIKNKKIAP